MYILFWILIGGIAGWIAEKITRSDHGLFMNIIVGIVGAVLGGWLLGIFGVNLEEDWIGSLITAVIGAVLLLFALKAIRGRR